VRQDAEAALANELAVFCESAGIDYFKASDLMDTEKSFYPSISVDEKLNEAYLLNEYAENLNVKLRLLALSRQINEDMVKHAVTLTQEGLRSCGKSLRRSRVAVLGTAVLQTATDEFIKSIILKGAKVSLYDPTSKTEAYDDTPVLKKSLNETVEGADCIVVFIGQEQFKRVNVKKLKTLMKNPAVFVDLVGLMQPEGIQTEGFIYCGLGRGLGKQ
jgi:UDP-N-acetyl-D-mannosaminuronate dehydrogenase